VQVQMGLYGGLTKDYAAGQVYQNVPYTDSVPLFFSEIDPALHDAVDTGNYGPGLAMTSTIDYEPMYFLINGQAFVPGQAVLPVGTSGGGTLLRLFNMGLKTRCPLLQGAYMKLIAEDGQPYRYPQEQYVVSLPAGKTIDAMVAFPSAGTYPIYDRRLGLTNAQTTQGGMLKNLEVTAGNFWPLIDSITATPSSIPDIQSSQLQVNATDADGPLPLSYNWTLPSSVAGSLSDPTIANPVYTPPFAAGTNTYTLTVTVSDGTYVDIGTVDITVKGYLVPVINSVTATPNPLYETQTSQLLVTATDPDGPSPLSYNWILTPGIGSLSSTTVANPVYTPPDVTGTQIFTLTIQVFDGVTTVSSTVDITVQDSSIPIEVIVDNLDAATSSVGVWSPSGASSFWATNSVWANDAGDSFTFTPNIVPGTGIAYAVYGWWTEWSSRYNAVPYEIRSGATLLDTINVNQQANGGQWNLLGIHTFAETASVTVQATPGYSSCADAVRFSLLPTLLSLEITGPLTVDEGTTVDYEAIAHFSGGLSLTVEPALWSVDVAEANINGNGLLIAGLVATDTLVVITAEYTLNGTTVSDTHNVTIVNSGGAPAEVIVDNLDADTSSVGVWSASGATGFWETNSVWANDTGDSFTFNANLVPGSTYNVYGWWTIFASRNTAAPYEIRNGATLLDTITVNQQANGAQWNLLGTYTFTDTASVTVLGSPGSSTNADAVRFVPVP
jgi:hypothetical protein